VRSVAFSPDGLRIVSGSYDKSVRVWNAVTGEAALPLLPGHEDFVRSVGFSPDGDKIISGSGAVCLQSICKIVFTNGIQIFSGSSS